MLRGLGQQGLVGGGFRGVDRGFHGFPKIGVGKPPKWMVKIMENPVNIDDLGGKPTIFGNIHIDIFSVRHLQVDSNNYPGIPTTLETMGLNITTIAKP